MSKSSAEALTKLAKMIEDGKCVQIEKVLRGVEVTVWPDKTKLQHSHIQGKDLIEAIMKASHD